MSQFPPMTLDNTPSARRDVPVDWRRRLELIVETMRDISRQTDPQAMVSSYRARMRDLVPTDAMIALSRRDLAVPRYRITRSTRWGDDVNPWRQKDRLPVLEGGLLGELIYGDEPRVIDDLAPDPNDPAALYLDGHRSLLAVPLYDQGIALNMVVFLRRPAAAFERESIPELVWLSNLFGRATHNLVLSAEVQQAYLAVDRELRTVAEIQRFLLPAELPRIPTLDVAAHYETAHRAGGDYYDFFPLADGRWGILIADVSGHGTPAAVVMAITHAIAHMLPDRAPCPGDLLGRVNAQLFRYYTTHTSDFVTAFYGIYDPRRRDISYACAGHPPPRLKRCSDGGLSQLDAVAGVPLGILPDVDYQVATRTLVPGDQIIFYTDGVTESFSPAREMFGTSRLDDVLENCHLSAAGLIGAILDAVRQFTAGQPQADDLTVLVARVT